MASRGASPVPCAPLCGRTSQTASLEVIAGNGEINFNPQPSQFGVQAVAQFVGVALLAMLFFDPRARRVPSRLHGSEPRNFIFFDEQACQTLAQHKRNIAERDGQVAELFHIAEGGRSDFHQSSDTCKLDVFTRFTTKAFVPTNAK